MSLKDALCARVKLLGATLMRQLRVNTLAAVRALNARFAFLSQRLLSQPTDSAELVKLSDFATRVFDDLALMQKAVYSGTGVGA